MLNRVPSRVLNWKSPYEVLYGKAPDYQMLRPFGCLAYAANLVAHRGKFDTRSLKCIFLGYEAFHKGYLLYNLDTHTLLISRDVKFMVDTFPYVGAQENSITNNLPFPCFNDTEPIKPNEQEVDPITVDDVEEHVDLSSNQPESLTPKAVVRRGSRARKPPTWLADYVGNVIKTEASIHEPNGFTPPTFPYRVHPGFTPTYTTFLFNIQSTKEPLSYKETCLYP